MLLYVYDNQLAVQHPTDTDAWLWVERSVGGGGDGAALRVVSGGHIASLPAPTRQMDVEAVLGVFKLLSGPYLVVVTAASTVALGPGHGEFRQVDKAQLVAIAPQPLAGQEASDERAFVSMVTSVLNSKAFYFAANYEVTHTAQRIYGFAHSTAGGSDGTTGTPSSWLRADDRFLWNLHLLSDFRRARETLPAVDNWVTPVINGFVGYRKGVPLADGFTGDLLLISRRSRSRQGTRFNRRGIDVSGDVANFVETEQLLVCQDGSVSSFVQIRGSIPVYWSQNPTMKYTPKCALNPSFNDTQVQLACTRHFKALNTAYGGAVTAVNLIDTKKDQLMLGQAFQTAAEAAKSAGADLNYVWFDFHKECRKMRYDRLSLLMERVATELDDVGVFQTSAAGRATRQQVGAVRTNCMDNLDRTNVVQSLFGRWAVRAAMAALPVSPPPSSDVLDTKMAQFEKEFKGMWADNADALSMLYSGTGALKTDFTRTGKRTIAGALQDGVNSVTRYVINNMEDGRRQDKWDLFLGRYTPTARGGYDAATSPLRAASKEVTPKGLLLGIVLFQTFVVTSTVAVMTSLGSSRSFGSQVFWGSSLATALFGLASFLVIKKGTPAAKGLVSVPHMTINNDVTRDSTSP